MIMATPSASRGPIRDETPIRFTDPLPSAVDVVVIGGGVIGVFASLYMARSGLKVLVCEKGRIGGEQSSRNWGWIRQHGRDRAELPVMMDASRLWEEVDRQTGGKTGFRRTGVMYLASSQETLERRETWLDIAREHQLDTRILSASDVSERIDQGRSGSAHKWAGATFTPSDARAEPWQAIPAVAELAQSEGVMVREACAVRALDIEGGRVKGVITENGAVACDQVILAAGVWSLLFAARHGVRFPQLSVRSTVCQTEPLPEVFAGNAADEQLAFRRREDGGYTLAGGGLHDLYIGPDAFRFFFKYLPVAREHIADTRFHIAAPRGYPDGWGQKRRWDADEKSPFERTRVLNPPPNLKQIETMRANFAKRFPDLGAPKILNAWAGMIDTMPDIVPIVDRVPDMENLIIATGMSGHGFGIGPGFGKVLAKMTTGKAAGHNLERFRFNRFSDGSRIVPGPSV